MTICSLVVQSIPEYSEIVNESLLAIGGVEIHAQNEQGKMVVSIDHPSREYCSDAMIDISRINGVMSTSLVFEYQEDLEPNQAPPTIKPPQESVTL
ncbi:MAG: chaperone NapD [Gammaproteobacteria bacterium]|nr:chaperone NapD [Gammaproteobacteria bacterium]